jgi:UDP-N-acetylglucosamine 2-epimerase (non-hydrolysing)
MDEGTVVMSAPNSASILAAVALVMAQQERFTNAPTTVPDYLGGDVSRKVVRIIMSYTPWVNRTTWSRFV